MSAEAPQPSTSSEPFALVVGAGPAGLMAAETLAQEGVRVRIADRMPSPARKFLLAGRGGLNLTHSEPLETFLDRYGAARERLAPAIRAFPPEAVRAWCAELGVETFIGSSGRVFPKAMKASPLLRAWLRQLGALGVTLETRTHFRGWTDDGAIILQGPDGERVERPAVVVFALGGGSWPRLGSDGGWQSTFVARGVDLAPLEPANCGFDVRWSDLFRTRFAGQPLKPVRLSVDGASSRGEAMITQAGVEGGGVYALSAKLRDAIRRDGAARLILDLRPDIAVDALARRLDAPRASMANRLRRAGLSPLAAALLRERIGGPSLPNESEALAALIKHVELELASIAPITRAISSAGGVAWSAVDESYALQIDASVFVAGEMLDWEAPTGGYLLQACLSTGRAAGQGALTRLHVLKKAGAA